MTKESLPGLGSGALREARRLILAIAKEAVELAIVRSELTWDEAADITEEQIAKDAALAIFGAGTCDDQPTESVQKLLALLSLSSPIEPSVQYQSAVSGLLYEKRGAAGDVSAIIINGEKFVLLRDDEAQASSEIRELAQALANGWNTRKSDPQFKADMDLVAKKLLEALAPSRQGAAKRVEG